MAACQSEYKCVDIEVVAPNITFQYRGEEEGGETPTDNQIFHSPVGCHFEACLAAHDAHGIYETDIEAVEGSLPEGATFDSECGMNSVTTLPYSSASGAGPVHPLYPTSLAEQFPPMPRRRGACKKCFRWEAKRGSETRTVRPCFMARDTASLRSTVTCFEILVPKCKYCVQRGDTLQYLNKRYQLNTNWLQLWNSNGIGELNPHPLSPTTVYTDPDSIANGLSIINAGPVYTVQEGEHLQALATLFRTTVKKILDVNPDIHSADDVLPGVNLCVMPCTDSPFVVNDNPNAV
eukprot:Tamp_09533.p1 GENE.Tamp_09533~~Tamp_09533.p1  ORF type:complete len:292 (+),score=32.55 Tamp_09533:1160-2035(+)